MKIMQAENQEFPAMLDPMARRIAAEDTALFLHCLTDKMAWPVWKE